MTENKRFSWEYSYYDSTGEIFDWSRNECLMTDYLQKYEIKEWCQELNKIVDENEQLEKENNKLKQSIHDWQGSYDELYKDNLKLEKENKELKKRDDLVSSYLQDEGSITLEKYEEIVHYLYKEWKKKRDLND